jgi:hypothetical protein
LRSPSGSTGLDEGSLLGGHRAAIASDRAAFAVWLNGADVIARRHDPVAGWEAAQIIDGPGPAGHGDVAVDGTGDASAVWIQGSDPDPSGLVAVIP